MDFDIKVQPQFMELYTGDWQEYALHSGRGAAKSYEAASLVIYKALLRRSTILCAREIQKSIKDSVIKLISERIEEFGLLQFFDIQKTTIKCLASGSDIVFSGLWRNINSIKSMHNLSFVWIEEAQNVSDESIQTLIPTVFRVKDAQILYTYNPTKPTDAVYKRFHTCKELPPRSIVKYVSPDDNKYLSDAMKKERDFAYKHDPEVANHVWGGALRPTSHAMSVIPMNWLKKTIGAHKGLKIPSGHQYIGFDVADSGDDHCAIAHVNNCILTNVIEFDSQFISQSVDFVHNYARAHDITRVYYDASGLGAGAKSDFNRLADRPYSVEAFLGGGRAEGYDNIFTGNIKNGAFFRNKKAQAWWALRLRVENTLRLLDGEDVDISKCFFINDNIKNIDQIVLELSQASYEHEDGKLMVDKQPNDEKSPNMADAIVMAFSRSIRNGLKAR